MYSSFLVEKFDQNTATYSSTTQSSSIDDSTPLPEDDVITGETVAKLLAKVQSVKCAECALLSVSYQGPYVYELFSIMVHSGSAIGGHYYAYIKYD